MKFGLHIARFVGLSVSCVVLCARAAAEEKAYSGPACAAAVDSFFVDEVWAKVGARTCLECHKVDGDAEDSDFVLVDPEKGNRDAAMRKNRDAFATMARGRAGDMSRLLLKPIGKLKHGGKQVIKPDSEAYRVLAEFVKRASGPAPADAVARATAENKKGPPFFDGVVMVDDRQLLRRVTLSLAGRLPTQAEKELLAKRGAAAIDQIMDGVMKEEAFYDRLREGFNDIFLTVGYDGVAETALDYEHFSKARGWAEYGKFEEIKDPKEREKYKFKVVRDYRKAMLGEPMKLVEYIVKNDRPFTEIVTADYMMVTPYTAKGYGIFDEVKDQFDDVDDPFEYIPVRLKALKGRSPQQDEDSKSGFYPHAGLLTTFQWIKRYPTTETNRNRARARLFYLQFLGVDVLELAARVTDAAAVTAKYPIPTMQASECVVCHKTLDPAAGCFQDYWQFDGGYGRRKGGWFTDMFAPGFEGESLPDGERWRALQWLGERTAKDPRFAVAMTEHVYYILTGRKTLGMPKDVDDPLFPARLRAYQEQRKEVERIAEDFAKGGFNLKSVFKAWVKSEFYRADGLASANVDPKRKAELDDVGLVRMLAPEQVERKVAAVFGKPWGKLTDQMAMLYGGIDSKEVTERATDPSGAMGAIQRILANDVACRQTGLDFSRDAKDRILFPDVEPDVVPGDSKEGDEKIRRTIVHLHERILGRFDAEDSAEVDRTFKLLAGVIEDAKQRKLDPEESYNCRQGMLHPVKDPKYAMRGWKAVVTYLLRREEFLYE